MLSGDGSASCCTPARSRAPRSSASPGDGVEEVLVAQAVALQVGPDPLDGVLEPPALDVVGEPVARRVVGRGVRAHPVGVGLHERRALAVAGPLQRGLRDGVRREHVVAVDADAGEAEAESPLVERDPGLALDRLGDGPLVVLAEEHDRRVVGRGEDERLVDVALRGGTVAEVRDDRRVAVGVAGADVAVALHAHGVAGRVQRLRADDDRVEVEVVLRGVPGALVDAAVETEQLERVDAAAPGDAVLAVGREDVVLRAQRAAGADLRGLLAEQLGPDAELTVALQRGGLGVDAAGQHHVAEEAADHLGLLLGRQADAEGEVGVLDALALGRQQLDELGAAVLLGGSEDLRQIGAETCPVIVGLTYDSSLLTGCRGVSADRSDRGHGRGPACDRHHTRVPPKLPGPSPSKEIRLGWRASGCYTAVDGRPLSPYPRSTTLRTNRGRSPRGMC